MTEDRISNLLAHSRGLSVANAHTVISSDIGGSKAAGSFLTQQYDDDADVQEVGMIDEDNSSDDEGTNQN